MSVTLHSRWRLTVAAAIHTWDNRFVISGATTGDGVYPADVGLTVDVDGPTWQVEAQYRPPGGEWQPSAMIFQRGAEQVMLQSIIGAEDPLPTEDFFDIRLTAEYLGGTLFDVPYRPYAVRVADLGQMPDGTFETTLGRYYMGVKARNEWGLAYPEGYALDISDASRADLATRGIEVIDDWDPAELAALGQEQLGRGLRLAPLAPGNSRTVYFKVDVSGASPRKHPVEFVCLNTGGMHDPDHPARRITKRIHVSRTTVDAFHGRVVSEAPQGTLRMNLGQVVYDPVGMRRARRVRGDDAEQPGTHDLDELRRWLRALLAGEPVDVCAVHRTLWCRCVCGDRDGTGGPRITYDPFYVFHTAFGATLTPGTPYAGPHGPLLFDDPFWKLLLAIIAWILAAIGGAEEAAQSAYEDEDFVIGTLHDFERHILDAAVCLLDTNRDLGFLTVLDAQGDEPNQEPKDALGGTAAVSNDVLTHEEVQDLIFEAEESGTLDPIRVFKSGARTGMTFAQMQGFSEFAWVRQDDQTRFDDLDRPTLRFEAEEDSDDPDNLISNEGDSGSVWVHDQSRRLVALNHSGRRDTNTATGSLLQYIVDRFGISF